MMKEDIDYINFQFVTRKHAKELKKLGFNEPCLGFFSDIVKSSKNVIFVNVKPIRNNDTRKKLTAPMYQQAISFLLNNLSITGVTNYSFEMKRDGRGTLIKNGRYYDSFINQHQLIEILIKENEFKNKINRILI